MMLFGSFECLLSYYVFYCSFFFFSSRRRHTRCLSDWSSDVCSSDLVDDPGVPAAVTRQEEDELSRLAGRVIQRNVLEAAVRDVLLRVRCCAQHQQQQIGRASCRERV